MRKLNKVKLASRAFPLDEAGSEKFNELKIRILEYLGKIGNEITARREVAPSNGDYRKGLAVESTNFYFLGNSFAVLTDTRITSANASQPLNSDNSGGNLILELFSYEPLQRESYSALEDLGLKQN